MAVDKNVSIQVGTTANCDRWEADVLGGDAGGGSE